jgi:hypothetical protein
MKSRSESFRAKFRDRDRDEVEAFNGYEEASQSSSYYDIIYGMKSHSMIVKLLPYSTSKKTYT